MSGSEREHLSNFLQFGEISRGCISAPGPAWSRGGSGPDQRDPRPPPTIRGRKLPRNTVLPFQEIKHVGPGSASMQLQGLVLASPNNT